MIRIQLSVVLNTGSTLDSPGEFYKMLIPRPYSRTMKSECLGAELRYLYFSSFLYGFTVQLRMRTI